MYCLKMFRTVNGIVRDYFQTFSWSKQMMQHYNWSGRCYVSNHCNGQHCVHGRRAWEGFGETQHLLPYLAFQSVSNILSSMQSSLTPFPLEKWTTSLLVYASQSYLYYMMCIIYFILNSYPLCFLKIWPCLMRRVVFPGTSKLHAP